MQKRYRKIATPLIDVVARMTSLVYFHGRSKIAYNCRHNEDESLARKRAMFLANRINVEHGIPAIVERSSNSYGVSWIVSVPISEKYPVWTVK